MKKQLGFGNMRIGESCEEIEEAKKAIEEYMRGEFCYFDLHPDYCQGRSQILFRENVSDKYPRDRFLVANKMPYHGIESRNSYDTIFENELYECGVTYFDYYMLHCINAENYKYHLRYDGFSFLKKVKEQGRAKKIGISFHGSPELLDEIINRYSYLDFIYLQINFCDWNNSLIKAKDCYKIAKNYSKEILVMEPIKGGVLSKTFHVDGIKYTPEDMADLALRFFADMEGITIVLSGMTTRQQVLHNRESLKRDKPDVDYERLASFIAQKNVIPCTECRYCERECVEGIRISSVLKYLNEACMESSCGSRRGFARLFYHSNSDVAGSAVRCIACKQCEKRCPQHLPISKFMKYAVNILEEEHTEELGKINLNKLIFWRNRERNKGLLDKEKRYRLCVYGAGKCFEKNIERIKNYAHIYSLIDNDVQKQGTVIKGIPCISISEISEIENVFIIIMVEDREIVQEMEESLQKLGIGQYDLFYNWLDYAKDYNWEMN